MGGGLGGGWVLQISSDGNDRRIFWGFQSFRFQEFLDRTVWQEFFLDGLI